MHGLLFSAINFLAIFVWILLLIGLGYVGFLIGLVIGFLVLFLIEGFINTYLTRRLWKISVKTDWKSLLVHGFLLFIALVLVSIPSLIINLVVPSLYTTIVLFIVYCLIDGFVARAVAGRWVAIGRRAEMVPAISWLFLVPAFVLLIVFVLYPVAATIGQSFFSKGNFVGLQNFNYVLFQKAFPLMNIPNIQAGDFPMGALIHNMIWIGIHLPLTVLFGLTFAVLLRDVKGGTIIKSIVFLGVVIPMVVGGLLFRFIYDSDAGVLNEFLRLIGLGSFARDLTVYSQTALISLILGSVWIWTGFAMIVYSAGLQGIPVELYEAAQIDGASRWKTFWRITVPMLRSTTIVVVTLTVLWELKVFDIVYVASLGGPGGASSVMAFDMYLEAFYSNNLGTASAIAVLLTLLTFGFAAYMVNRMSRS